MAVLSVLLEESADEKVHKLCLEGFRCLIRLTSLFDMVTERNAFVTALSTFTLLKNAREMKQKNIDCIKALLALAHSEVNYLKDTWRVVLDCCR